MVCAVEEIEISTLFRGEGKKICLNTFDSHYSAKFIITSVVLDIRDRSLFMARMVGRREFFVGIIGTLARPCTPFSPEKIKTPALFKNDFSLEVVLGHIFNNYSMSTRWI